MTSYKDAFPSKYISAEDVKRVVRTAVTKVDFTEIEGEQKLECYFENIDKSMILNKTNATMLELISGTDQFDHWTGVKVILRREMVQFKGKLVPSVRIYEAEANPDEVTKPKPEEKKEEPVNTATEREEKRTAIDKELEKQKRETKQGEA